MGVADVPIRILDAGTSVRLEDEWLAGKTDGLLSQRLSVDPDDPSQGRVWTQWTSLAAARAFAEKIMESNGSPRLRPTGPATFLADPRYLGEHQAKG